ncbi:MAG: hypothetical protein CL940_04375 [Deltaproteobacteria bacterium]|nr:hypothetical protein [Deltaproteobacteria bacterium]
MSLSTWTDRALFGPVDRARVAVLERVVYAVLAFDLWIEMVPHGSRYGAGGLNVAHFAWLDVLQGLPDASTYLAVIFASGVLCLGLALGLGGRAARWAAFALYTYGWAMSQLDSYQHHFFLSIVLFHFALDAGPPEAQRPERGCAWPYQLLVASIAIVYAYTGLSKTEEAWLMGDVLVRINASGGKMDPFLAVAQSAGLSAERFWWLGGHMVVLAQWLIVAGYLAVFLDPARRRRSTAWIAGVGLLTAVAFHAGAEYLELRVGWFSAYMFLLAAVILGPAWPWRLLRSEATGLSALIESRLQGVGGLARAVGAAAVLGASWACQELIDLPSTSALGITAVLLTVVALWSARSRDTAALIGAKITCVLVVAVLCLTQGTVHYDFYRYLGGDLVRRDQPVAALDAYGKANSWAPPGEGRHAKVRKIQATLPGAIK